MAEQAKVTSIEALEAFRACLIIFVDKAHSNVDQVGDDVRRVRSWVQDEQRMHWEREIRRRDRILGEAKQELMRVKLSGLRDNTFPQEEAVRKAKRALDHAEEKLRNVKRWTRDYDHHMDPLLKRLGSLFDVLDRDMPKAMAYLLQAQRTLEAYTQAGVTPSPAPASTTPDKDSSTPPLS